MTEEQAREKVLADVPRETADRLTTFVEALRQGAVHQNLIAASTLDSVWNRHILDSAQLLALAPDEGLWLDIGSGAGLPGLVVAAMSERTVVLVEPRAKRCEFLRDTAQRMGMADRVTVIAGRAETAPLLEPAVISARAVAALPALFEITYRFAQPQTLWLLPKGRSVAEEVAAARASWHARIELVPSVTDADAAIVVATDIRPKRGKRA